MTKNKKLKLTKNDFVNGDKYEEGLGLHENNLNGTIPDSIGNLKNLCEYGWMK